MQLKPQETFAIVRQLDDPFDSETYYVQAKIRNAETDALLATINLDDKGSQRFRKNWTVVEDTSGEGFYIDIETMVYTDSGYSAVSETYRRQNQVLLIQERATGGLHAGGGSDVDYKRIEKIVAGGKKETTKQAKVDLKPVLKAIGEVKKSVDAIEAPDMAPVLARIDETGQKVESVVSGVNEALNDGFERLEGGVAEIPKEHVDLSPVLEKIDGLTLPEFQRAAQELIDKAKEVVAHDLTKILAAIGAVLTAVKGMTFTAKFSPKVTEEKEEEPLVGRKRMIRGMKKKESGFVNIVAIAFLALAASLVFVFGGVKRAEAPVPEIGDAWSAGEEMNLGDTQGSLEQWKATTSPFAAITTRIAGKDIYVPTSDATSSSMSANTFCINNSSPDCITAWPTGGGGGGGNVTKVGTPVNDQIGVWTGDGTLEGDAALTFDTTTDTLSTTRILGGSGSTAEPTYSFTSGGNSGMWDDWGGGGVAFTFQSAKSLSILMGSTYKTIWDSSGLHLASTYPMNWGTLGGVGDIGLSRTSAGLLKVNDGTTGYGDLEVADEAYDATAWNGSQEVPTKNALRDKIEALSGSNWGVNGTELYPLLGKSIEIPFLQATSTTDTSVFAGPVDFQNTLTLASGAIMDWDAGDVTLTHSPNTLTLDGGVLNLVQTPTIQAGIDITGGGVTFQGVGGLITAGGNALQLQGSEILISSTGGSQQVEINTELLTGGTTVLSVPDTAGVADTFCLETLGNCISGGGGSGIATSGPIADTEVIYGTGVGTVDSEAAFTYNAGTNLLTATNASTTLISAVTGFFTNILIGADTLAEYISDTSGAMWTGNTETGGAITYQDADNTLDFVLDATGDWTGTIDGNNFAGGAIGAGDLLYGASAGSITELAIGASSTVLTTAGSVPKWEQLVFAAIGGTLNLASQVTGALGIANGGLGAAFTDPNADQLMFWDDSSGFITGIATLAGAAISGTTLTINDVTCTDCLTTTEIADSYLLNNGDVGTGDYDFGGANFVEIPNGTGPTANDPGEIAHDTTDNQLVIDDFVLPTTQKLWGATIASSSVDFVSGGRIPMPPLRDGATITEIHCFVDGGTSVVINVDVLANGSPTDTLTCDADGASDTAQSANTSKTALSLNVVEIGTITGVVDYVTFSVWGTWTRE